MGLPGAILIIIKLMVKTTIIVIKAEKLLFKIYFFIKPPTHKKILKQSHSYNA